MTTSRPAFVRLAVAIAMATTLSAACGPPPTTPPPDDGTRCPSGSMYGCDKPDLGSPPDLVTPPDLDPPAGDMAIIQNGMDCTNVQPTMNCFDGSETHTCTVLGMDHDACYIQCADSLGGKSKFWRVTPPNDPNAVPDYRFWITPALHLRLFSTTVDCK